MAKQGIPGLVQVPPSDREIAKRRLARWTFLLVAIICGISTLNAWLAPPDNQADCQPGLDGDIPQDFREACNQAETGQAIADGDAIQQDLIVEAASQETAPIERQTPTLSRPPQLNRPLKEPDIKSPSQAASQQPTTVSSIHTVTASREERAPMAPEVKPVRTQSPDAHLAEQGDAFAQYRLGKFYAKHSGPEAPESVSWYMKASRGLRRLAEKGNGEAMYVLGVMYAFGRGVQMDTEEARRWLTQAVEHQVAAARPVLARLVEKHRPAEADRTDNGG